jgi:hypothetical protein
MMVGPLPSACSPSSFGARRVARRGDVEDDGDVRLEREDRSAGSVAADLLLRRGDGDDVARRVGGAARSLERDVGAEPVVERARDDPAVRQLDGLCAQHRRVAGTHEAPRVLAVAGADVDVEIPDVGRLALGPTRRGVPSPRDHALHTAEELDSLADEGLRPEAADATDGDEAALVDVGRDQADLVDVADEGAGRAGASARDPGEARAERVAPHLGERCRRVPPDGGRPLLGA